MGRFMEAVRMLGTKRTLPGWVLFAVWTALNLSGLGLSGMIGLLESRWVVLFAVIWTSGIVLHFSRNPSRRRLLEIYPRQMDVDQFGRSLRTEADAADELWVAYESGSYYTDHLLDAQRAKITKMLLLAPEADYIRYASRWDTEDRIRGWIAKAVENARMLSTPADPIEVKLIDAPLTNMVIGLTWENPLEHVWRTLNRRPKPTEPKPRWIRVQIFTSTRETKEWPNLIVTRWSDKETFRHLLAVYNSMWLDPAARVATTSTDSSGASALMETTRPATDPAVGRVGIDADDASEVVRRGGGIANQDVAIRLRGGSTYMGDDDPIR